MCQSLTYLQNKQYRYFTSRDTMLQTDTETLTIEDQDIMKLDVKNFFNKDQHFGCRKNMDKNLLA